jgi:hypothetical protein
MTNEIDRVHVSGGGDGPSIARINGCEPACDRCKAGAVGRTEPVEFAPYAAPPFRLPVQTNYDNRPDLASAFAEGRDMASWDANS